MDPDFRFDPDSDDEAPAPVAASARRKPAQSPWEFSAYANSVAAEHAQRRTTSIDEKISQALRGRINPSMPDGSEDEEEEDAGDDSDEEPVKGESGDEEDELEESDDEDEESEGEEVDEEDSGEEDGKAEDREQGEEEEEEEEAAQEVSFGAI